MNRRRYPWKVFVFLWLAGTVTSPLVLPYYYGLLETAPNPPELPQSLAVIVGSVLLRNGLFMLVAAGLGLLVARQIGLGAPYLESWLEGAEPPARPFREIVRPALFWAVATALIAFAVDAVFVYGLGVDFPAPEIHARIDVPAWRSGLASFWAPFTEETLDRLLLLSLVAWLGMKLFRVTGEGRGRTAALWTANVATAFFFGWYHISNEQLFAEVVPSVVAVRTVLIVMAPGLAFGWLFWRYGLEAAILSHFAIDVVVHFVRPLVESWLG